MYAVIKTGGKQHRVAPGQTIRVEKIEGQVGDVVTIGDVLLICADDEFKVGQPLLAGASVTARIVEQHRDKKVKVFKRKRRKGYRRTKGHRQYYTALNVQEIQV